VIAYSLDATLRGTGFNSKYLIVYSITPAVCLWSWRGLRVRSYLLTTRSDLYFGYFYLCFFAFVLISLFFEFYKNQKFSDDGFNGLFFILLLIFFSTKDIIRKHSLLRTFRNPAKYLMNIKPKLTLLVRVFENVQLKRIGNFVNQYFPIALILITVSALQTALEVQRSVTINHKDQIIPLMMLKINDAQREISQKNNDQAKVLLTESYKTLNLAEIDKDEKYSEGIVSEILQNAILFYDIKSYEESVGVAKRLVKISNIWVNNDKAKNKQSWQNLTSAGFTIMGLAQLELGEIEQALKSQQEAQNYLEQALAKEPENGLFRVNLAIVYRRIGDIYGRQVKPEATTEPFDKARKLFESVINDPKAEIEPTDYLLENYLSIADRLQNRQDITEERKLLLNAQTWLQKAQTKTADNFWGNPALKKIQSKLSSLALPGVEVQRYKK